VKPVRLLEKSVDNPPQSEIRDAAARRANVLGVYEIAKGADPEGKRVLLIDDICTTGATMTECIRVLKDAGAAEVVFPDGSCATFSAMVKGYTVGAAEVDGAVGFGAVLRVTGGVTVSEV
jgi:predicted phosphoribosyltransferase